MNNHLPSLIQIWGLILLTLHVAAPALPPDTMWSLWPYAFLPTWLAWSGACLMATLTLPAVNRLVAISLSRLPLFRNQDRSQQFYISLITLLGGGLFYMARLSHLRWGDGYFLTLLLPHPDPTVRVIYNWQAPLTVMLHQRMWQFVADPLWGGSVAQVYAVISIGAGMLFVYLMLNFALHLGRDQLERAIIAGLVLTVGSMQLFFGYVENYTLISVGLLISMIVGWLALQGRIQPFWPILALSVTNCFHPSTVFLWPGMLWLMLRCYQRGYIRGADGLVQLVITPLLIGGSVFTIMEMGGHGLNSLTGADRPGGGDGIWFVPLFAIDPTNPWQRYSMFAPAHLLDWTNIHLLISPFGLPLIGFIALTVLRSPRAMFATIQERDFAEFLALTSLMYVGLTFVWNADYGGQKDWDLFAPSAFVYTLLAGYCLVRAMPHRAELRQAGLFAIAVSLLHTASWIFANTHYLPHD
ncbi:hypothetical protein QUF58_13770 [Anaerolineales bacterium HSG24]|nr:hypothetical protein [Anaerolineales bacterium HSG24]